jgi:myo-inositol-1(or 4)-monophosphatase
MTTPSTPKLLSALRRALAEGGRIVRRYAASGFDIGFKGVANVVTTADRESERAILRILKGAFPDHGFLMEESGARASASPYRWVVDPLDGTVNFAHGVPVSCVSIAVDRAGEALAGGVLNPFSDELFLAVRGRGATLNGKKIRVSKTAEMIDALMATGFPYDRKLGAALYVRHVQKFIGASQGVRRLGAAALDMAYVACGRFDGYWETNLKPWDSAAGRLLVAEAGGKVTDFSGRPYTLDNTRETLASNGLLHPAMVRLLPRG